MTIPKIKALHGAIQKAVFTIYGDWDYPKVTQRITLLAQLIDAYPGASEDWLYIGESGYCCIDSLIVGAYWHYSNWHGGQSSPGYAALSALGRIFQPGMTSQPQRGDSEWECFKALDSMARRDAGKPIYDFVSISL
jgi:hypothetical protein